MESTYGSDKAGLVCAFALRPDLPARAISADEAAALIGAADSDEFLWLHFSLTNTASEPWLHRHAALPEPFFESHDTSSTRLEVVDDGLLGVLNDVRFSTAEVSSASTVTIYVSQRLMVTARTTQLRAIDRLRAAVKSGETFGSPAELLAHLLHDQADVLVEIVRDATRRVDAVEDRIISHQRTSRPQLGMIRRVLVRMQRLLAPEPAALFRLLNKPPPWVTERDLAELRQSAEELSAAVVDCVALNERVRLLQEELTAMLSERTNQTLFILTVVTVLALPMTIIPGLFGMNVQGIPFSEGSNGFWIVAFIVICIVGMGVTLAWTRLDR
jgi:zinc transporter